jgi:hypothetical protein
LTYFACPPFTSAARQIGAGSSRSSPPRAVSVESWTERQVAHRQANSMPIGTRPNARCGRPSLPHEKPACERPTLFCEIIRLQMVRSLSLIQLGGALQLIAASSFRIQIRAYISAPCPAARTDREAARLCMRILGTRIANNEKVTISDADWRQHQYAIGASGGGKTETLMAQELAHGRGALRQARRQRQDYSRQRRSEHCLLAAGGPLPPHRPQYAVTELEDGRRKWMRRDHDRMRVRMGGTRRRVRTLHARDNAKVCRQICGPKR